MWTDAKRKPVQIKTPDNESKVELPLAQSATVDSIRRG